MNWTNVLNTVQLALYVAGITVLILLGSQIVSSRAQMQREHEKMMFILDRTLGEVTK